MVNLKCKVEIIGQSDKVVVNVLHFWEMLVRCGVLGALEATNSAGNRGNIAHSGNESVSGRTPGPRNDLLLNRLAGLAGVRVPRGECRLLMSHNMRVAGAAGKVEHNALGTIDIWRVVDARRARWCFVRYSFVGHLDVSYSLESLVNELFKAGVVGGVGLVDELRIERNATSVDEIEERQSKAESKSRSHLEGWSVRGQPVRLF